LEYVELGEMVAFFFGANDQNGSGVAIAAPEFGVRKLGDTSSNIVYSGTAVTFKPTPSSPADSGVEIGFLASSANGFEEGNLYGVFTYPTIDGVTPVGYIGKFGIRPVRTAPVVSDQAVMVDHDYGGADALQIVRNDGHPIDGATVHAFVSADWAANRREPEYIVARALTDANGRWTSPMLLNPGNYVLLVYKAGEITSDTFDVTVA
jgi:hypothetical protein